MSERNLLGRDDELRRLAAALEEARGGRARMFLLLGEPGIGKTRLCDELGRIAEGVRVGWGRCWETGFAPAYWPFTQILRAIGPGTPGLSAFPELALLAPELFANARPLGGDAREVRFQLFDAMARFLARAASEAPLLLFLDDLHAADEASLRMLQFVLKSCVGVRLMIVGTQRDVAAKTSAEVSAVLHAIGRDADKIALRRLSVTEVEQWIALDEPQRAVALATTLHQATEGNPLFVAEVLRVTRARGAVTPRIPDEVRAALTAHLELADEDTRRVLSVAALIGREFDEPLLAEILEVSRDELRDALDRSAAVGLTVERGDGRHAFVHVLLRDELERALPFADRADWHFRIGEALAAAIDRSSLVRAVHHLGKSGREHVDRLVDVAKRAAAVAGRDFAFDDAMAVLDLAAKALPPGDRVRLSLEIDGAEAQIQAGEGEAGRARAVQLAERARGLRDNALLARAALVYGTELLGGRADPAMIALLEEARASLPEGPSPLRARVTARLGSALIPGRPEDYERAANLGRDAIEMADEIGDDATRYSVLQWALPAMGLTVSAAERAPLMRRFVHYAEALGDPVGELRARHLGLMLAVEEGVGREACELMAQRVQMLDRPYYAWRIPLGRAIVAFSEGRIVDAEREARAMFDAGGSAGVAWVRPMFSLMQMSIVHALDDPNACPDLEDRTLMPATEFRVLFASWLAARRGRFDEARELRAQYGGIFWKVPMIVPAGDYAFRLGDRTLAAEILRDAVAQGEPEQNPFVWGPSGAMVGGPTALILGRCASVTGQLDDAIRFFELGIAQCHTIFPTHRAQMERDLALLLRDAGRVEDARSHLVRARELGERYGMTYFVEHLPTLEAPRREAPRAVARAAADLLLAREGDVWRLEGLGATVRLEDRKGVHYLERLLREPNRELHVLDLIGVDDAGDAGAVLDSKAKASYRARLETLRDELEEARRFGDRGRVEKYEAEMDAIAEQLARGVGLGGRDRKAASGAERARVNVQRRLRDVLERVEAHAPALGRWLAASIKTGTYCSYVPLPEQ